MMIDPLPLKSCSRCIDWRWTSPADHDGVVRTVCRLHNAARRGSDTCGAFQKIPEIRWEHSHDGGTRDTHR